MVVDADGGYIATTQVECKLAALVVKNADGNGGRCGNGAGVEVHIEGDKLTQDAPSTREFCLMEYGGFYLVRFSRCDHGSTR